ncbi:universal stress protein [Azospirillum argentinense]|uniref:Universal stress protein n=1 Tax=Azospirillum argentinense TaxID=2970906 RepID=A0A2K1FT78_9PROT|nr:universal stress protein [Azospirillum argentinense]PNQ95735.1 universal stress protein [Azospirillum argentinense]
MPIKDILVHVGSSPACADRLALAANLARRYDAYLIGAGAPESPTAEDSFRTMLRSAGVVGEWRGIIGLPESFVARQARGADLVILGQHDPDEPTGLDAPEDVILACGRPVLVVPHAKLFEQVGAAVLIGWNGSREATRAVHDALPLMEMAATVTVLSVNPEPGDEWGTDDVVQHLARHGLIVRAETFEPEALADADALRSRAVHIGADLIVMGAYGRSRLREMILGGMTQDVLENVTVPVLMAH